MTTLLRSHLRRASGRGVSASLSASLSGSGSAAPTSAAARAILHQAGFDTPEAVEVATPSSSSSATALANGCPLSGSLSSLSAASALPSLFASANRCPCGLYASADAPASCAWAAKKQQQQQQQTPQAKIAATTVPALHASSSAAAVTRTLLKQAEPSMAAMRAGVSLRQSAQQKLSIRTFSTSGVPATDASPSSSSGSASAADPSVDPLQPPAITLPPSLSAAHSGLLAIEEYRSAIQSLGRPCASAPSNSGGGSSGGAPPSLSSFAAARQSLQRTLDIVAYIPGQPWFSLHVKSVLAWLARKSGSLVEEHRLRGEVLREMDKMAAAARRAAKAGAWGGAGDAASSAPSLKPADTFALHQAINALALSALRTRKYSEVSTLADTWLTRMEAQLFGGATTTATAGAAGAATTGGAALQRGTPALAVHALHHAGPGHSGGGGCSSASPTTFATGASHSRLLAEYLTMMEVAMVNHAFAALAAAAAQPAGAAPAAASGMSASKLAASRASLSSRIVSLASHMSSRSALAASLEWALFRGELLMLPRVVHQCFPELERMLPTEAEIKSKQQTGGANAGEASTAVSADASSPSLFDRAILYFARHPELARLPLSDSNLRRAWYSPLVHAYLGASEEELISVVTSAAPAATGASTTDADAPASGAAASASPADAAAPASADGSTPPAAASATPPAPPRSLFHLGASLRLIEGSLSSSACDLYLLRTLAALAAANYRAPSSALGFGDAIQAEGLFRAVVARCESMLISSSASGSASAPAAASGAVVSPSLNAPLYGFYLCVLLDYLSLLSRLSWNGRSRLPEARALFLSKLVAPLQRDARGRAFVAEQLWGTLPRQLGSGSGEGGATQWIDRVMQIQSVADVTDDLLALPLRALPALPAVDSPTAAAQASLPSGAPTMPQHPLPEWLVEKLQVGSGVCS